MKKLLIIEDDQSLADALRTLIYQNAEPCELVLASTTQKAFEIIESKKPDTIILEMKIGDHVIGPEVIRKIKNTIWNASIIVLTGFVNPAMESEAKALGVDAYFEKPIEMDQLQKAFHLIARKRSGK